MDEGAQVSVDGENIADNGTAMAQDGRIVFSAWAKDGYEITSVLVDGEKDARHNGDSTTEYIIEGIKTDETVVSVSTQALDTEASETGEDSAVKNVVTFQVAEGAAVTVAGEDVADNGTAMAKDGTIVFFAFPKDGYEITSVIFDGDHETRKTSDESGNEYIIEGIQTDETVVSVSAQPADDGIRRNVVTFEVAKGAAVTVDGENVADGGTAMAKDGTIIFTAVPEEGYEITSVIFDGDHETRKTDNESGNEYILEGIQTDETVISVSTQGPEAETEMPADDSSLNNEMSTMSILPEQPLGVAVYEFYDGDDLVDEQIIKNGDELLEPEAPAKENKKFMGWRENGRSPYQTFGVQNTVVPGTHKLYAHFEEIYYVFFLDQEGNVFRTKEGIKGTDIYTADVDLPTDPGTSIVGWWQDESGEDVVGEKVTIEDKNVTLYPKVANGHWMYFETGKDASYQEPIFVAADADTSAPAANPTRTGYTFAHWSAEESGSAYIFGGKLERDITLHAVWTPGTAEYTVIYWKENANWENPYLEESKQDPQQYSYMKSKKELGTVGTETEVTAGTPDAGFEAAPVTQQTIASDGSTVVNVYYKRIEYKINFHGFHGHICGKEEHKHSRGGFLSSSCYDWWGNLICGKEEHTHTRDCRSVVVLFTIIAKYGAQIGSQWPDYNGNNNWSTVEDGGGPWQANIQTMPLGGGEFYIPNEIGDKKTATYYVEVIPGETGSVWKGTVNYKVHHTDTVKLNSAYVSKEDRYPIDGFTLNERYSTGLERSYDGAEFYYTRNSYNIVFMSQNEEIRRDTKKYEESLETVNTSAPALEQAPLTPDGIPYKFVGWYDNELGQGDQIVFPKTMPAYNITVYAKWELPTFTVRFHKADGEVEASIEVPYGEKLDEDNKQIPSLGKVMPEGYTWFGWVVKDADGSQSLYNFNTQIYGDVDLYPYYYNGNVYHVTYNANNGGGTAPEDSNSYWENSYAEVASAEDLTPPEGKVFLGWSKSPAATKADIQPKDKLAITGDVVLYAIWGPKPKKTTLTYHSNFDTDATKEYEVRNNSMVDLETYASTGLPQREGYTFDGWATDASGTKKVSGSIFVDSTNASEENHLYATWKRQTGRENGLTITKNVKVPGTADKTALGVDKDTFSFTVTGPSNFGDIKSVTYKINGAEMSAEVQGSTFVLAGVKDGDTVTVITPLPTGTYTVTETFAEGNAYTYDAEITDSQELTENGSVSFTAKNTLKGGQITVKKTVKAPKGTSNVGPFTFDIKGETGEIVSTVTVEVGGDFTGESTISVPTGSYTVTEQLTEGYTVSPEKGQNVTVTDGGTAEAEFTNTITGKANVTISKTWNDSDNAYGLRPESVNVTLTDTTDPTRTYAITLTETDGRWSGDGDVDLYNEEGQKITYEVKEAEVSSYYTAEVNPETITPADGETEIILENTLKTTSKLTIKKSVNGLAEGESTEDTFTFTVIGPNGVVLGEASLKNGGEKTYKNIPAGTYTVTEILPADSSEVYISTTATGGTAVPGQERTYTVEVEEGEEAVLAYTNTAKNAALIVTKTANKTTDAKLGDVITYTITVKNTGNVAVSDITVTDPLTGLNQSVGTLIPGEDASVTTMHTITEADILAGSFVNTATATGTDPDSDEVTGTGSETVTTVEKNLALKVTKLVIGSNYGYDLGETVKYHIYVENTGNQTLENVTVEDPLTGDTWTIESLAPGAKESFFTKGYTVTEKDILDGKIENTATATVGEVTDSAKVSVETAEQRKHLTISKTVEDDSKPENGSAYGIGETITYSVTVTNDGNVTLTDVQVKDELTEDEWIIESLAPGTAEKFTASHVVTEADIRAGHVLNVATTTDKDIPVDPGKDDEPTQKPDANLHVKKTVVGKPGGYKLGEKITFHIVVTNNGNVTLSNVTVSDAKVGLSGLNVGSLAPGENWNKDVTYTVTEKDILEEKVQNIAYASGVDPYDKRINADGDAEVSTVPQKPGLEVTKYVVDHNADYKLGDTVKYHIYVKNTGNLTLNNVNVTDSLTGDHWTIESLAPGETKDYWPKYKITEEDILKGSFVNTAKASGTASNGTSVEDDDTVNAYPVKPNPHITVTKMTISKPTNGETYALGETIIYNVTATNDGNLTLTNVVITDELTGDEWTIESLAPGASEAFTANHVVTEADILKGSVVNVATATGTSPNKDTPPTIDPGETEDLTEPKDGHLTVTKMTTSTPKNGETYALGETITYSVTVTNDGNLTLTNVVVTDDLTKTQWIVNSLAPGESRTFNTSYTVREKDIRAGKVVNEAAATGTSPDPDKPDVPTDPGTTGDKTDEQNPALKVTKKVIDANYGYKLGDKVRYIVHVENTGNVTLSYVTVTDELTGDNWIIESLAPGAIENFVTGEYTVTEDDILEGSIENTATAKGIDANGTEVTDSESVSVTTVKRNGHLTVTKTTTSTPKNGETYALGETITYSVTVTNDGNLTITDVKVTDELTNTEWTVNSLVPGESRTFNTSYAVREKDIRAGKVVNEAAATGTSPDPDKRDVPTDPGKTEDKTDEQNPALKVTKKVIDANYGYKLGDKVRYSVHVENTGNVTLSYVTVTDELTGDNWIIESLAPGAIENFVTEEYTVTEADILKGNIENTAVAKGIDANGTEVTDSGSVSARTVKPNGHLTITKEANEPENGKAYALGETITYTVTATNDGNLTLTNITVTDKLTGDTWTITKLAPDESESFTAKYEVTEADVLAGHVLNEATAEGTSPDSKTPPTIVPGEDDEPVQTSAPDLFVEKTVNKEYGAELGEELTFTIKVTNNGNVTIKDIKVSDELTGNINGKELEIGTLAPGKSKDVTVTYTVTEADIIRAMGIINTAVAAGTTPSGRTIEREGKVRAGVAAQNPKLTVEKKIYGSNYGYKPGDKARYKIIVTNTGNVTLTYVTVTDDLTGESWTIESLAPGAVETYQTKEYTVTEADVVNGKFTNTAAAQGMAPGNIPITAEGSVNAETVKSNPHITITKKTTNTPANGEKYALGERITYEVTATNDGNLTITDVVVTDELTGDSWTIESLAPGESRNFNTSYVVTEKDLEGEVVNKAVGEGTSPDPDVPPVVEPDEVEDSTDPKKPEITTVKTLTNSGSGKDGAFQAGETATFDIVVENTGNTTQKNVVVADTMTDAEIVAGGGYTINEDGQAVIAELAPGAKVTVKAAYTVKQEDIDNQTALANTATVDGEGTTPDPDPEKIPTDEKKPGLTATKKLTNAGTGENGAFKAGDTAAFDITVTNSGNTTQTNVTISEQLADAVIVPGTGYTINADGQAVIAEMAPGAEVVVKATYEVTQADIDSDVELKNIALVDGDNGEEPDPTPEVEIPEENQKKGLSAVKTVTNAPTGGFKAGEIAEFDIAVTNTGNTTQKDVIVTEQLEDAVIVAGEGYTVNDAGQAVIGTIAPEATVTVKATYEVKQADIDSENTLKNIAVINGGDPTDPVPNPEVEIPREPKNPGLTAVKIVTNAPEGGFKAGETAAFDITVTNTGNTTQTDVVVAEQLAGAEIVEGEGYTINEEGQAVIAEMAPNATVTVKAEYIVTQEDIDSDEELRNIAKVGPEDGPEPGVIIPEEPKTPALTAVKAVTNAGTGENGAFKAGETAEFDITVTNTGNMTQTNVVVAEQLAGAAIVEGEGYTINEAGQAVIAEMAPDAAVVVKAAYEVTQEDIDSNAELTNIALVEGDNGTNPDPEPEITIPTEPKNGHVTITKTTTSTPANGEAYVLGETITYSITAENDGNLTLTDVVVTDALTGDSWTVGTLEPGETSEGFTASHVVTEADILAGSVVNVATATGTSPDPEEPDVPVDPGTEQVPTEPKDGHLTIAKTVTGTPADGEAYALGETITYSITATNDGNLTLTNVVVTDALTGDSWTIAGLAPGESQTFTAIHVVTEADILAGGVVNVATATGTSPDPEEPEVPVIPGTEEIQTDPKEGHLTIAKTATSTPANGETYVLGETVTYEITAANDGNLTITDITVADELTGDEWTVESLAPGASESFTAAHVVTEADILAGSVVNVATATGTSPDPEEPDVPVTPGTEEIQTEPKEGHLTIAKATTSTPANGTAYELGETITYSITAVNDGNLTITDITVTDELTADSWTVESLAPGESQTFTASHVVTEADTLAGSVVNTAVAEGTSPDPDEPEVPVTPGETEDPVETPVPSLYVEKTAAQAEGGYALGDVVTYAIRVVNNGNTDVSGITVNDPLTGNSWTVDALAEGGEAAFTATHVVAEADILAGSVTNVATAAGTAPDGSAVESEDSATVITEESRGHIAVAKTATSAPANGTAYTLGETVTYEITAANDGNLTITDITVTDELTGDSWTVDSLAPGADQTFTTTHVVTEADISAGSVLNVATAAGTSPDPEEPEVPVTPGQEEVLTEDRNPAVAVDKAVTSTPAAASGRYAAGETVTYQVTVTNTGNLTLENLTLEDMITRPGGAQVVPEGIEEGLAGVESLAPGESASVTYSYVVTEADLGGSLVNSAVVEGTPVIPDPTPETPELQPQDNDSETVLTEEPADSTITISKTNVDGLTGELLSLPGAQFYVALFADEQLTQRVGGVQTLAFGEDQATVSAAFEGLEPGTYYIAETDAEGNVLTGGEYGGGTFTPEYAGGQQVVITESGQSTAAAFQNLFAVLPEEGYSRMAELTVTKEVRDTSGAPMNSDETFYAGLFYDEACTIPAEGVSQQIIPFEMNGGSSASATAEVTILGDGSDTVLYVTEVTADGTPVKDAADFPYEVTVEGGKVTVNADSPEASARIINVAEEPGRSYYEAGDLTVTKEVRNAEGRLVNSDETFYAGIFSDSAYTTLADNVSQPVVELNMQGASKMSVSVEVSVADEESDTILYVTEVTEDGKPVSGSASFAYDVTVEGGTVVMNGNTLEGNVKIVNAEASAEEPGEPEEPGTEEPGTEEPGTEEPGTEEPGTEESGTEEPGTEKPGTGDNGTDDGDNDRTGMSEAETEGSETVQSVRTGDETPVMTWMILFLAAALAMFLTAVSCFRKRRSR